MSITSFTPPFSVGSSSDYGDALNVIHDELHTITKNITYLDAYNITDVVVDSSSFGAQVSALSTNSSLVINSQPFFYNGVSYNTGDIVLKISSGEIVHIKAQPGGIFFPSKVARDQNGNYSIQYTYSKTSPEPNTKNETSVNETTALNSIIEFKGLSASDTSQSYIYGVWASLDTLQTTSKLEVYTFNGKIIYPQLQFWYAEPDTTTLKMEPVEELCIEYTLEQSNGYWNITIDSGLNQLVENSGIWVKVK